MNAIFKSLLAIVIFSIGLFLAVMSFPLPAANLTSQLEYTLGVFPYLPPSGIQKRYLPVAADFSEILQIAVRLKTRDSFKNFQVAISQEEFDIIFIQPFDFVRIALPH